MKVQSRTKGFTLIETIVAVSIFIIFMVIVMNIFFNLINENKRARDARELADEAVFIAFEVKRELESARLSTDDKCHQGVGLPRSYTSASSDQIIYKTKDDVCSGFVRQAGPSGVFHQLKDITAAVPRKVPLTTGGISMDDVDFFVFDDASSGQHPMVIVTMEFSNTLNTELAPVKIQFAATPADE